MSDAKLCWRCEQIVPYDKHGLCRYCLDSLKFWLLFLLWAELWVVFTHVYLYLGINMGFSLVYGAASALLLVVFYMYVRSAVKSLFSWVTAIPRLIRYARGKK